MTDAARCPWANSSAAMAAYHDSEWGVPSHDDHHLFEMLILEGAQAGLSWSTVLAKRGNYREALDDFDWDAVARYEQPKFDALLTNAGIIRNRLKIAAATTNARAFIAVRHEFGSFDAYLWQWVDGVPVVARRADEPVPARTDLSDRISKDLKRRGFTFVGTTIVYAYLQSVGVVNDHRAPCELAQNRDTGSHL